MLHVPAAGRARVARSAHEAVHQRSVRRSLHDRRIGRQGVSQAKLRRGQRLSVQVRLSDRRHAVSLRRQGVRSQLVRAAAVQTRDARRPFASPSSSRSWCRPSINRATRVPIGRRRVSRPAEVPPPRRRRSLRRRLRRVHRQLRDQQLLLLPVRQPETVHVHPVGQERSVQGRPHVVGLPQHFGRARLTEEPTDDARALVSGSVQLLSRYAHRVLRSRRRS